MTSFPVHSNSLQRIIVGNPTQCKNNWLMCGREEILFDNYTFRNSDRFPFASIANLPPHGRTYSGIQK